MQITQFLMKTAKRTSSSDNNITLIPHSTLNRLNHASQQIKQPKVNYENQ